MSSEGVANRSSDDVDVRLEAPSQVREDSPQEATARFDRDELVRGWRAYAPAMPNAVPVLKYAAKTDMGQVRENNEDKFDFYEPEQPAVLAARGSLFAVGDGIGGAQAGQIASEMMLKCLIAGYYDSQESDLESALADSISRANDRIFHLAQMIPERNGMGTTLSCAVFHEDRVVVMQVGDSRAYLLRDGAIRQVTLDHSWVEEQVRAGVMTRQDAESSPFRNVITRSVGAAQTVHPDLYQEQSIPGDIWVLCSDGLTGYVTDEEILQVAGCNGPSEAARQFIELANARGGRDNITVMVVSVRNVVSYGDFESIRSLSAGRSAGGVVSQPDASLPSEIVSSGMSSAENGSKTGWRRLFGH